MVPTICASLDNDILSSAATNAATDRHGAFRPVLLQRPLLLNPVPGHGRIIAAHVAKNVVARFCPSGIDVMAY